MLAIDSLRLLGLPTDFKNPVGDYVGARGRQNYHRPTNTFFEPFFCRIIFATVAVGYQTGFLLWLLLSIRHPRCELIRRLLCCSCIKPDHINRATMVRCSHRAAVPGLSEGNALALASFPSSTVFLLLVGRIQPSPSRISISTVFSSRRFASPRFVDRSGFGQLLEGRRR
jgi:hypothetical protein